MAKTVLILGGSPRAKGNTQSLCEALADGVRSAGNQATVIHLREKAIQPCIGCYGCAAKKGSPCIQKDDMQEIYDAFEQADVLVFASPLYWWGLTAQMKICVDRLFAIPASRDMKIPHKDCALVIAAGDAEEENFRLVVDFYQTALVRNLRWTDRGMLLAGGVNAIGDVQKTGFLQQAKELGGSL